MLTLDPAFKPGPSRSRGEIVPSCPRDQIAGGGVVEWRIGRSLWDGPRRPGRLGNRLPRPCRSSCCAGPTPMTLNSGQVKDHRFPFQRPMRKPIKTPDIVHRRRQYQRAACRTCCTRLAAGMSAVRKPAMIPRTTHRCLKQRPAKILRNRLGVSRGDLKPMQS